MKRLVIPIRNREDPFFDVAPWFLGKGISVDEIADEDLGALFRHDGDLFESVVTAKTQCITVDLSDDDDPNQIAYEVLTKAQYVFKALGQSPLAVSHAAMVSSSENKKAMVEKPLSLPGGNGVRVQKSDKRFTSLVPAPARLRSLNRAPEAPSSRFLGVPAAPRTRGPTWMHRG